MKIEVWSDFVCPFCYIGKRKLELALENFEHRDQVRIEFKSYELAPDAKSKKGMPLEYANQMNENVGNQAAKVGLLYNFDTMQHTNTFDAHRIAKYAETKNLGKELVEKLLHAFFTDSELISDYETLKRLAMEVGLDEEEVEDVLETKRFRNRVLEDKELARQIGVQGIPFFVFNEKYSLSGAQPQDVFEQVLVKVWEEECKNPALESLNKSDSKTTYCMGKDCEVEDE
ncbi:DsbA family protein [Paucisalibacillus sp. EB02]|uniref:DsbA family oxidoreductase n=1 Tax=Paucisalibacillus sp. EB02 TaxID=1347087 RepID=UPI0004B77CE5|nr:DsbA family oxidoreductase [Paucisalibacillus sp. EB02]